LKQLRKRASKVAQSKPSLCEPLFEVWADFFLESIPLWVAPSFITFTGLVFLFAAYLAFVLNDIESGLPWIHTCLLAAGCYLVYATLNTLDEKQGERTGSASALSDVFNIACDAFAICLVVVTLSYATLLGVGAHTILLFCIIEFTYFVTHWQHYHCGSNADSIFSIQEGLLGVTVICCASAWNPDLWALDMGEVLEQLSGIRLNHLLVYCLGLHSLYLNLAAFSRVYTRYENSEGSFFGPAMMQLLPVLSACSCTVVWANNSPTQLFQRHPHWFFLGIGLVLGNLCVRLVTSNMSKQRFSIYPYMITLLLLCTVLSVTGCYGDDKEKNKEEEICLAWFFAMGLWNFYNLNKNVCLELSRALDLGIFVLKKTRVQ